MRENFMPEFKQPKPPADTADPTEENETEKNLDAKESNRNSFKQKLFKTIEYSMIVLAGLNFIAKDAQAEDSDAYAKTRSMATQAFNDLDRKINELENYQQQEITQKKSQLFTELDSSKKNPETIQKLKNKLNEMLNEAMDDSEKLTIIDKFLEIVKNRKPSQMAPEKSPIQSPEAEKRHAFTFNELDKSTEAFANFLNPNIDFATATQKLKTVIGDKETVEYNGIRFSLKGNKFYVDGREMTEESRQKLIDAYQKTAEEMRKMGVNIE